MIEARYGQVFVILSIIIFGAFFVWKLYTSQIELRHKEILRYCITAALLHLIAAEYTFIRPITVTNRTIDIFATCFGLICSARSFDLLLRKEQSSYQYIWKTEPIFIIVLIAVLLAIANALEPNNLGLISDGDPYHPTKSYYLKQSAMYGLIAWLISLNMRVVLHKYQKTVTATLRFRRALLLASSITSFIGVSCLTQLNIILSLTIGDGFRPIISAFYQISYITSFFFALMGLVLSHKWMNKLSRPFQKRDIELLSNLLDHLKVVVPQNLPHTSSNKHSIISILVEISDRSRILWTNIPFEGIITPEAEASQIYQTYKSGKSYHQSGELTPPIINTSAEYHYFQTAKHLESLIRSDLGNERDYLGRTVEKGQSASN